MRRRRRTKYNWLPVLGQAGDAANGTDDWSGRKFALTVPAATDVSTIIVIPVTFDESQEQTTAGGGGTMGVLPLSIFMGGEYILKRIVGKIHLQNVPIASSQSPCIQVGCGFLIAREDPSGNNPIEALTVAQAVENYGPLFPDTMRSPWIWRRTWLLGNPLSAQVDRNFPVTNANYGSVMDGPHVDARTARRVLQDQRLWFVAQARDASALKSSSSTSTIEGVMDVRLLGALRKARNRSAF